MYCLACGAAFPHKNGLPLAHKPAVSAVCVMLSVEVLPCCGCPSRMTWLILPRRYRVACCT